MNLFRGGVCVSVSPPVGELVRAVRVTAGGWDQRRRALRGLTECNKQIDNQDDEQTICRRVFEAANVAAITSTGNFLRFAGRSMSCQSLVLVCVSRVSAPRVCVSASCCNMALANLLAAHVAAALQN